MKAGPKLEYRVRLYPEDNAKPLKILFLGEDSQDQICPSEYIGFSQEDRLKEVSLAGEI